MNPRLCSIAFQASVWHSVNTFDRYSSAWCIVPMSSSRSFMTVYNKCIEYIFYLQMFRPYQLDIYVGYKADARFEPSQWETALLCNDVFHWLGASLESALWVCCDSIFFIMSIKPGSSLYKKEKMAVEIIRCHHLTSTSATTYVTNTKQRTIVCKTSLCLNIHQQQDKWYLWPTCVIEIFASRTIAMLVAYIISSFCTWCIEVLFDKIFMLSSLVRDCFTNMDKL